MRNWAIYYFVTSGAKSLRDLCMEVVLLATLQQLLEPEQLHLKLPNYVPPTVQTSIVRAFQAQTVDQVMHLPSADQSLVPKPKRMRLWNSW